MAIYGLAEPNQHAFWLPHSLCVHCRWHHPIFRSCWRSATLITAWPSLKWTTTTSSRTSSASPLSPTPTLSPRCSLTRNTTYGCRKSEATTRSTSTFFDLLVKKTNRRLGHLLQTTVFEVWKSIWNNLKQATSKKQAIYWLPSATSPKICTKANLNPGRQTVFLTCTDDWNWPASHKAF